MLQTLRKNKVVKNAGWIIAGKVANKLLAFVVGVFAARYLGPGNYGLINYAAAYATFFASLCTLGINSILVKNFVDHPEQEGETIGTTLLLRAVSSLLSALAIVGIVSVVDKGEPLTVAVVALYSIGLVFQVFDTLNYWFQSRLQSKYSAIAELVSYAAMSAYKIILLALGKSVEWFAVASALDYIVLAVFLLIAYFRNGGVRFCCSLKKARELLQSSYSFIIAGLMVSVYACTDKLMLKQMLGADAVGHYSLASTVSVSWAFLLSAVIDSLYPEIVQSFRKDRLRYERKNRQLYAIVIYASLFVSALICLIAKPFVVTLYGEKYLAAVMPLRIVVWYTAFSYLGVARNAWMVCENQQKYLKYLYISAAALNVVLNLALIPLWGASGAAAASLITQASTTILLPALIRPLRPNAKLMLDAVRKYSGVDFNEIHTTEEARAIADEKGIHYEARHKKGDILNLFFEEFVEEHLTQPTFVMDHPIEISPLTKKKPDNPDYVERFEFFMNGWEMANAYSELNDPEDQRRRFEAQEKAFAAGDEEANHTDEDFLNALAIGMPPTGGIGFGIDRLVMLLTDSQAIRDVLLFPTMKSLDK